MSPRRLLVPLLLAALLAVPASRAPGRHAAVPQPAAALTAATTPDLRPYRGPGMWVDIYDHEALRDPAAAVANMAAHGVRTLYLETGNWKHRYAVVHPARDSEFIEAAHAHGMNVVTWYLPKFESVDDDFRRAMRSLQFTTTHGQRPDSFGLDIEAPEVEPTTRIQNLLTLSARLRAAVGSGYALGAIIPSPRGMIRVPTYWPNFPYRDLPTWYDVILPMSYYTFHYDGAKAAHRYISDNIHIIRQQTGRVDIPIHPIGGLVGDTSKAEAWALVQAARERGVTGVSLYDYAGMTEPLWSALRSMPVQPGVATPSPAPLPSTGEVGNLPGGDARHPKEAFFATGPAHDPLVLRFQAFDAGVREVSVHVNRHVFGWVWHTPKGGWSTTRKRIIPAGWLRAKSNNLISFVAVGNAPSWSEWGVRAVSVEPA